MMPAALKSARDALAGYPLASPSFDEEEIQAVLEVMRSGRLSMGERVAEFEARLAEWMGVEHAVFCNSGSSANLLLVEAALRRLNPRDAPLKAGDEVLVPALAWPTSVWPLAQLGLVPVFVDVSRETLAMDLGAAEAALGPRTRGLLLIHVLGLACDMAPYVEFCSRSSVTLMEDCCESFGAFDQGRHVGTFGYGGTISHYFSHQLTTIEGGTVFTHDARLADDLRSMRAHGWIRDRRDRDDLVLNHSELDPRFLFVLPGYNLRPMELQAALGLVQLGKIDGFLDARLSVARQVTAWCEEHCPWLEVIGSRYLQEPPVSRRQRRHSWMNIPFRLAPDAPRDLQEVREVLARGGVETRAIIAGNIARHPAVRHIQSRSAEPLRECDRLLERGFMIGCHPLSTEKSLDELHGCLEDLGRS